MESTPEDDDHPSSAEHGLTASQDAHGLVRPDRWGTVLGAAGSLALAVVLRGNPAIYAYLRRSVLDNDSTGELEARLRRLGTSLEAASADLGASSWQTFRYVTFPMMRGSLVAGAVLAFALSFDEVVVTTFTAGPSVQTLPIWIFGNLFRPNQAPVINVVAAALTLVAVVPVWLAQRIGGDPAGTRV